MKTGQEIDVIEAHFDVSTIMMKLHIDEAINKNWVSSFISKPWNPEDLKMKIESTIGQFCNGSE